MKKHNHLKRLEYESIQILRETATETENPVTLYSVDNASLSEKGISRLLHHHPLLNVDITWKFQEVYKLRDKAAKDADIKLLINQDQEAVDKATIPLDHSSLHAELKDLNKR